MRITRELSAGIALLAAYVMQTSVIARLDLPLGGPNLIFLFFLTWAVLHDAMFGAMIGFTVGLLVDLAPPAASTAGEWTMVLTVVGYGIGAAASRNQEFRDSPLVDWGLIAAGLFAIFAGWLILGFFIGEPHRSGVELLKTLFGLLLWNLAIAPSVLAFSKRVYGAFGPRVELLR